MVLLILFQNLLLCGGFFFFNKKREILFRRGASSVVAFDIAPKAADAFLDPRITVRVTVGLFFRFANKKNCLFSLFKATFVTPMLWIKCVLEPIAFGTTLQRTLFVVASKRHFVARKSCSVGPFHPPQLYDQVNYQGTLNVIEAWLVSLRFRCATLTRSAANMVCPKSSCRRRRPRASTAPTSTV